MISPIIFYPVYKKILRIHNRKIQPMVMSNTASMKDMFGNLGHEVVQAKMEEQKILSQSAVEGGPSSTLEALRVNIDLHKIGMRSLSKAVGLPRKKLLSMLYGRVPMELPTQLAIINYIDTHRRDRKKVLYG